ncbi:MAG: transporter, partial [Bacteroidetes bacterium]|nr:transporter [Bacteroidota bacterium]
FLNSLSISQILFAGFRGVNLIRASKDEVKAAGFDLAADKANIKNSIITTYYNHYKLIESKKVVLENIKVMQQRLKDAQNLRSVGMALKNDELQIQLAISNLQQTADDIQSAIDISNYNLGIMLGLPDNTQIEIGESGLFSAKPSFDEASGVKNALMVRPEIKAADIRFNESKKRLAIARGMYAPIISAGFNAYYSKPNQRVFIEDQIRFHDSWDIGVKLSWNISNIFTTNFVTDEAKANIRGATAAQQIAGENIRMEVNANYSAYKTAIDKIELNQTAIDQAIENQRLTKDQLANGVKNTTDMLNADNQVITSQIGLLSAKIDAEIAYAKLMKATGNN